MCIILLNPETHICFKKQLEGSTCLRYSKDISSLEAGRLCQAAVSYILTNKAHRSSRKYSLMLRSIRGNCIFFCHQILINRFTEMYRFKALKVNIFLGESIVRSLQTTAPRYHKVKVVCHGEGKTMPD